MRGRALLAIAVCLLAACTVTPHLMPTPAVFKDERLNFEDRLPAELRSTRLPVFYATTRAPARGNAHGPYSNHRSDRVHLGVADVRLGEPGWSWADLVASNRTDTVRHPRLGAVESVHEFADQQQFVDGIDAQLARTRNQELVLYIHGYRVTFDEVAVQMGSFAHFLGHGVMVTFQWPTKLYFWNYLTDCPRAERYIADIERLITVLARSSAEKLNVMAYSCGSPLLATALARLRARHPDEGHVELAKRYRLGNVIFVGSDVDLRQFARDHLPPTLDLAEQLIIYVSRNDRALFFSNLIARGSKLGRPDVAELAPRDLERLPPDSRLQLVDVSDVRGAHEMGGMKGHGYWYANDWISTDVTLSLRHPIPPAQRCLVNQPRTPRVWRMPDDYLQCVADRLLAALPELRRSP